MGREESEDNEELTTRNPRGKSQEMIAEEHSGTVNTAMPLLVLAGDNVVTVAMTTALAATPGLRVAAQPFADAELSRGQIGP